MPDVWVLQADPSFAAVQSFLRNNPFIFECDNTFRAAVFAGVDEVLSEESIEHLRKAHDLPGIAGVTLFRFSSEMDPQIALSNSSPSVSETSL